MHWTDDGIVLSARPQDESSAVVQLLTRGQGRHAAGARDDPASAEGIDGPVTSTGGGGPEDGVSGPMAFQTRADL